MKNRFNSRPEQAVALVIVLAMLVLLSGLIVSFMTSVRNERAASVANSDGLTSHQLADSTVNLVISQIRQATAQGGADGKVTSTTWASQPGAIRTLSGKVASAKTTIANPSVKQFTYKAGDNDYIYKLYSADQMKIRTSDLNNNAWDTKETGVIEKWDRISPDKAYVDLNEPVLSPLPAGSTGNDPNVVEPRYPIIDPRAKFGPTEASNSTADPGVVDGFDIKTSGLADATLKFIAKDAPGNSTNKAQPIQYLPMPVKWLYVMRDGSMAAADGISGKISGASDENPIIGRTAFWTDDDSCKLNINTASEGTFWDTPSVSGEQESGNVGSGPLTSSPASLSLGASQPARGEFQRYPGHPATTCLSPAIGWLWGILPTGPSSLQSSAAIVKMKDGINSMAPFSPFSYAGTKPPNFPPKASPPPAQSTSMGGNYNPDPEIVRESVVDPISKKSRSVAKAPLLAVATKHLYATVDEYIYNSSDRGITNATAATTLNNASLNPDALEKVRFFLTANSRSPELNLFGRPRVTFWPVNAQEALRTGYDDLFAFTSTLYKDPLDRTKDNIFFLTRYDAKHRSNDFMATPGGEPSNKNQKIYEYLQAMTGNGRFTDIPGFGGNFKAKYPAPDAGSYSERDQILTEIFDYCRTINLVDTSKRNRAGAYQPYTPFYGGTTEGVTYPSVADRSYDWSGQVTPLRTVDDTNSVGYQGLGRFPMISEAAIVFHRSGAAPAGKTQLQATLILEMATVMPGYPALRETFWTRVTVDKGDPDKGGADKPPLMVKTGKDSAGNSIYLEIELIGKKGDPNKDDPNDRGLINIVNVASHDATYGRGFMPTLGFLNSMCYYPENLKGPSDVTKTAGPFQDMGPSIHPIPKTFVQDTSTFLGKTTNNYKRGTTCKFYPYVSKVFQLTAGDPLVFRGGNYIVEIFAGEGWDDNRNSNTVPVQTVHLHFPDQDVSVTPAPARDKADGSFTLRVTAQSDGNWSIFRAEDVIRSIEFVGPTAAIEPPLPINQQGDLRLGMAKRDVPDTWYRTRLPGNTGYFSSTPQIHGLTVGHGDPYGGYLPVPGLPPENGRGLLAKGGTNRDSKPAILPAKINGVEFYGTATGHGGPGDYDRGLSKHEDGAFGNKVDEGNVDFEYGIDSNGHAVPYYRGRAIAETGQSFFSPNRQLSSAVMFGSLPTGAVRGRPWQTLLFRPDRGSIPHPGAQTDSNPADHLLLDLFNLPVVEPYAISEAFSSGGKVNLNYVIAPFGYAKGDTGTWKGSKMPRSYLRRDTALRGVLKAVKIMAVPTGQTEGAHTESPTDLNAATYPFRFDIDAEKTLDQFEDRLKDPARGLFRSASEICDMDLYPVPAGNTMPAQPTDWTDFWENKFAQTGDNMRERPYSHIYPRVTTKSNTYTIHMRCQAIKKTAGTRADEFNSKLDKVAGEYRGSATIERFIDPNDIYLRDYKATDATSSVDQFYRFRVVSTKQFLPR